MRIVVGQRRSVCRLTLHFVDSISTQWICSFPFLQYWLATQHAMHQKKSGEQSILPLGSHGSCHSLCNPAISRIVNIYHQFEAEAALR